MNNYNLLFDRNIGLLSQENQGRLKNSTAVIFGVGGLGGVIAEVLTRSGIGNLKIIDRDVFEPTNFNRQIFAFSHTIGRYKVDAAEEFLLKINPEIKIEKYYKVTSENIDEILTNATVALLALDDVVPIILISRLAKAQNIPLVEGWALPFGNVRVFTANTPSLEEVYEMDLTQLNLDTISDDARKKLNLEMLYKLKKIKGIQDFYTPLAMERISKGQITSFAPMVWLTSVLMSIETIKLILGWGTTALSPDFALYDPFSHSIPESN
jgi:molybdopterin/thiamine biosynthesis adenylyltransferase